MDTNTETRDTLKQQIAKNRNARYQSEHRNRTAQRIAHLEAVEQAARIWHGEWLTARHGGNMNEWPADETDLAFALRLAADEMEQARRQAQTKEVLKKHVSGSKKPRTRKAA